MFKKISKRCSLISKWTRFFSLSNCLLDKYQCRVLIVGGGVGGCALGFKLSTVLNATELVILEPSKDHYNQEWFTLCGAGIKKVCDTIKPMTTCLPKDAIWVQEKAAEFCPKDNIVVTSEGDTIEYEVLVLAVGTVICWNKVPGLLKALQFYDNVGTIYSPVYAEKTYCALQRFKRGNVIATHPQTIIKSAISSLNICFLMDDILRSRGLRHEAQFFYHTSLSTLHPVRYYERTLYDAVQKRDINVDLLSNLVEVRPDRNEAVFRHAKSYEQYTQKYAILHAAPPMQSPVEVTNCRSLVNPDGHVEVDKYTMQHVRYPNIFAIGDCCSTPNLKTAAACAAQAPIVYANIASLLAGKICKARYDGYALSPIVTAIGKCAFAECDYSLQPKRALPFSQKLWETYSTNDQMIPRLR